MATQEDDNGFEQVIEVTDTSKLGSSPLGMYLATYRL